jgi:hypothetical protein
MEGALSPSSSLISRRGATEVAAKALFIWLIIRLICLVFSAGTVFFS